MMSYTNPTVDLDRYNAANAMTSTTGLLKDIDVKPGESYLVLGQNIGCETRENEFKQGGGGYLKRMLKDHVTKYVCGFLNSGEGGALWVGVDDNGTVQGLPGLSHREEDVARVCIDSVIRGIKPQIFPQNYKVSFIQVVQETNDQLQLVENTKVLKISVQPIEKCNRLYETAKGEAYIRRDGSTQGPMHASDILEYAHMLYSREIQAKDDEIMNLRETLSRIANKENVMNKIARGLNISYGSNDKLNKDSRSSYSKCSSNSDISHKTKRTTSQNSVLLNFSKVCTIL